MVNGCNLVGLELCLRRPSAAKLLIEIYRYWREKGEARRSVADPNRYSKFLVPIETIVHVLVYVLLSWPDGCGGWTGWRRHIVSFGRIKARGKEGTLLRWTILCPSVYVNQRPTQKTNGMNLLCICIAFQLLLRDVGSASARASKQPPIHRMVKRGEPIQKVSGKELFRVWEKTKEEYNDKAFGREYQNKWRVVKEGADGLNVAMLHHPTDPVPYVRMHATMPGSVDDVWGSFRLSNWERLMGAVDPFFEELIILEQFDHGKVNMVLANKRAKRLVTFGKRDFLFVSVSDQPRSDGVLVSGTVSVVTPKYPRVQGYVRAYQDSIGFYEPHADDPNTGESRTSVTIVCRIDLNDSGEGGEGGHVPMWLYTQTIGLSGSSSLAKMRKQMRLEMEERQALAEGRTFEGFDGNRHHTKTKMYAMTFMTLFVGLHCIQRWF